MTKSKELAGAVRYDVSASPPVDQVGIAERAARFTTRSIKGDCKRTGLDLVLSMIDLTTLEGADTPNKVRQLCSKAEHLHDSIPGLLIGIRFFKGCLSARRSCWD